MIVASSGFSYLNSTQREKAPQEEKAGVRRSSERNEDSEGRAMITPALREALTKQGDHLPGLGPYCSLVPRMGSIGQGCYGDKEKVSCWLVCQLVTACVIRALGLETVREEASM